MVIQRGFRRTFVVVLLVLAVLVGAFATLDRAQGPKLSSAQIDPVSVALSPAQTLQLSVNQPIAPVKRSEVSIRPAAPFTVLASMQQVVLRFPQPLHYATTYRVEIAHLTSAADGVESTLRYTFRTADSAIYYLQRNAGVPDRIIRIGIGATTQATVYSAVRIQDFAVLKGSLAVVTLNSRGDSALSLISATGRVRPVPLPGVGAIGVIHADDAAGAIGFTFTSSGVAGGHTQDLFLLTPDSSLTPVAVKGLGGTPLAALNWYFVPGSSDVVVLGSDGSALLANPTNPSATTPFGSYFTLNSVSPDGKTASVSDIDGALSIALPGGKPSRLTPSHPGGAAVIGGAAQLIPGGWLQIDSVYDATTGGFTEHLAFDNGSTARDLFTPANPLGSIDSFSVSPGAQYVSIETTPDVATAKPDGYRVNGRAASVTTELVDVATGTLLATLQGFDAQWSTQGVP
ncbi:MAG TPA: hypothetical protein VHZ81_02100 [Galbitalea sp.]|nr:hypothetical protein [Galbitalea sp.]